MLSSFFPVVPGRTSDALRRYRSVYQLNVDQAALGNLEEQLSTGRRFNRPSEDPSAAIRVIGLQRDQEFKTQALQNLKSSQSFLDITESTLNQAQSLMNDARGLAVEANNNTLSDTERAGLVSQVDAILQRMVTLGNTRFQDRYLLAGGKVDTVPFSLNGSQVQFKGDNLDLLTIADESDFVAHNVVSQTAFGVRSSAVVSTIDLNPGVLPSTRLSDLNSGLGIAKGAIQFSDGTNQVSLDISGTETLQDVRDLISGVSLGGRTLQASLSANGLDIDYADAGGGVLRVTDIGIGTSAKDLGIETSVPIPSLPIQGGDLDPIVRRTTTIAQLQANTGLDLQGGIEIIQGTKRFRVELSNAQTVEDMLNAIERTGAGVKASITEDGRSLQVRSIESGTDFSIQESQGDLASRLGLRTFGAGTRLDQLNHGRDFQLSQGPDLFLEKIDGQRIQIDLEGAVTIQDVIDRINLNVSNQDPLTKITASVHPIKNSLVLSSPSTGGTQAMKIIVGGGSEAAWSLGLVPQGETEAIANLNGTEYEVVGIDPNPQEVEGIFNTLIRLRNSIADGDSPQIARATELLDADLDRMSLARGALGVTQQRIDRLTDSNEESQLNLKAQESENIDTDFAQVVSELQSRQAAQEATLSLLSQVTRLSLFDYL